MDVIKHPMDLGTVMTRLKQDQYRTFEAFSKDVQLIFDNCRMYNQETSDVVKQANKLEKLFHKEVQRKLAPPEASAPKPAKASKPSTREATTTTTTTTTTSGDRPKSHLRLPSADEKNRLCKNIFKLKPSELGEVVHLIDQLCPQALDKTGQNEIDIDVDLLDTVGFRRADAFAKDCLAKSGAASGNVGDSDAKRARRSDDDDGE